MNFTNISEIHLNSNISEIHLNSNISEIHLNIVSFGHCNV